jgi:Tol biopolymer transport system component
MGWLAIAGTALVALLVGIGVSVALRPTPAEPMVKLSITPPEGTSLVMGAAAGPPALSPDGRKIAFVAEIGGNTSLWVRPLDSLTAHAVAGTDGARSPFWSPDGRTLGFFAQDKLRRIDEDGGTSQTIANVPGNFAAMGTWGRDGKILFAAGNLLTLFQVDANGGQPVALTKLTGPELGHFWPALLPDGRHFLFGGQAGGPVYAGNIGTGDRKQVLADGAHTVYIKAQDGRGYLVYVRQGSLLAQPFDASSLATTGEPKLVADGVEPMRFTASNEGTLAFRSGEPPSGELFSFDRTGKSETPPAKQTGVPGELRFSPDGRTLAVSQTMNRTADLYLRDLTRDTSSRFTFDGGRYPLWTSDGTRIVFRKPDGIYVKAVSGGDEQRIFEDTTIRNLSDLSPDDDALIVGRSDPATGFDMWILRDPLGKGAKKLEPLMRTPANEGQGRFSPTKPLRVAYTSEESGQNEIYVINMPGGPAGKWQISTEGGYAPRWRGDGRELYFVGADLRSIMAVDIDPGPVFRAGTPRLLFKAPSPILGVTTDLGFAVRRDGQRFLLALHGDEHGSDAIQVILHWRPDERN